MQGFPAFESGQKKQALGDEQLFKTPDKYIYHIFLRGGGGGRTWLKFCWVCAAGLSEPLPYYSLFCGQL